MRGESSSPGIRATKFRTKIKMKTRTLKHPKKSDTIDKREHSENQEPQNMTTKKKTMEKRKEKIKARARRQTKRTTL